MNLASLRLRVRLVDKSGFLWLYVYAAVRKGWLRLRSANGVSIPPEDLFSN
jgi:hypothetical protein